MNIDQKIIKKSYKKMFISGNMIEIYTYKEPYFYNTPVRKRNYNSTHQQIRRKDNTYTARTNIRRLITANINQPTGKPVFVTLTFNRNITNLKEGNYEFTKFIKRLNNYTNAKSKYLSVIEFQKKGRIHYHTIFFGLPYISYQTFETKIWKNGDTNMQAIKSKSLKKIRNIGAYVSKYLSKANLDERLTGHKAYFTSRGLIRPQRFRKETTIDRFLTENTMKEVEGQTYKTTRYNIINYKQYELCKLKQTSPY